jgi:putative ABC transport system substrate-binding protein
MWPFAARAQQPARPVLGLLGTGTATFAGHDRRFRRGLANRGGRIPVFPRASSIACPRWPLISLAVGGGTGGEHPCRLRAVMAATATIPIVLSVGGDPVELGLIATLSRPGGNVTGIYQFTSALEPKRLDLLHELAPSALERCGQGPMTIDCRPKKAISSIESMCVTHRRILPCWSEPAPVDRLP